MRSVQLPGSHISWEHNGDSGPALVVSGVVNGGLSEFPTAPLTAAGPRGRWVTALAHQSPRAARVVRVLEQDGRRRTEGRLTADVQLKEKHSRSLRVPPSTSKQSDSSFRYHLNAML